MDKLQGKPPASSSDIPLPNPADPLDFRQNTPWREPRRGDLCPVCQVGRLAYDGLMNLACPECEFVAVGCFT